MQFKRGAALAVLILVAMAASAQSLATDLKTLIEATGLKYQVTKSGNVAVTFAFDGDRSQIVYMTGKGSTVDDLVVREVWSNAGYYGADVDAETLLDLLMAGSNEKLGAWSLEEDDGDYLAYFSTSVPMTISGADLASVLEYVARAADAREATLSDVDDN